MRSDSRSLLKVSQIRCGNDSCGANVRHAYLKRNMKGKWLRVFLLLVLVVSIGAFYAYDLGQYFTIDYFKSRQQAFSEFYRERRISTISLYMGIYILVTALSLPGAAAMTLAGGALFGLPMGTVIVSFSSSIGATLAFLASRFLLRDWVRKRYGGKLAAINRGMEKDGAFYLFTLRMVPLFPFFVINLAMGVTAIRTSVFYAVSQIGMLAGTLVYVNAGVQLAKIDSLSGILSLELLFSFALLGIFPLVSKRVVSYFKSRKTMGRYRKPKKFDFNLIVIGAGSAGLVSAYIGAAAKAKTALIEKDRMGGDCLYTGCVPSKALIRSAKMLSYAARAEEFGFDKTDVAFNFAGIMKCVRKRIEAVEPHDSIERYRNLGVHCFKGKATVESPWVVRVDGKSLTTRSIIVATGARPVVPPLPGLDQVRHLTSDNIWNLEELPERLVVLGGGPIGCEMAQTFARLGSKVTQIEMDPRILAREDREVSALMQKRFQKEGVTLLTKHRASRIEVEGKRKTLVCSHDGAEVPVLFDEILFAVGRIANTKGFGLEELGVEIAQRGTIKTDKILRTNFPNIFCAGDVAGPYQFTHTAGHQAWYASINALFGRFKSFKADYRVVPWSTFTDPEVARVGLNELEADRQGVAYEVTKYGIEELDRAIADSENVGFVKVLTVPNSDRILGVTIVGPHAGDIIAEYVLAMKYGLGLNKILSTIHIYPTLAEANRNAAGEWRKRHQPKTALKWAERYFRWVRR